MSKALKCDCCKTCFDPSESKGEITTFGDFYFQDGMKYQDHEISHRENGPSHLCPRCTLDFRDWFYKYEKPVEEQCTSSVHYTKTQTPMKFSDLQKNDLPPSASCASSKAEDAAKQKNILMENIIAEIDTMASEVVCRFLDLSEAIKTHVDSQK